MIKKLKRKFVGICLLSALVAILFIVGTINVLNYHAVDSRLDSMIDQIAQEKTDMLPPDRLIPNVPPKWRNDFAKDAVREANHFVVYVDGEGAVSHADIGNMFTLTSDQAAEYAEAVAQKSAESGVYHQFKYLKTEIGGEQAVVFLDCSRDFQTLTEFFENSILISGVALILILIASFLLSSLAIKPIASAYEKQKKFITNASHELKTPLTVIGANTDILEMSSGPNRWIDSTRLQVGRMTELVNSLVSLARMDENLQLDKGKIELSEMVNMIAGSFDSMATEQEKVFRTEIAGQIVYNGNEKALSQLVYILLDNAFKYSDERGTITLSLQQVGNAVHLKIVNTVEEISPGTHREFFDRFYRGDESHNCEKKGYGIGLSLAKSIVEAHKGEISAVSPDGHSVEIRVIL